uniref:Protein kinase domain-containing protein n=1 Tax=Mesocestoides corti TaxID=53468 RepID=A0A5K3EIU2_MESCO
MTCSSTQYQRRCSISFPCTAFTFYSNVGYGHNALYPLFFVLGYVSSAAKPVTISPGVN